MVGVRAIGLVLLLLACAARADAARILVISDQALGTPQTPGPDDSLIDTLLQLGHEVDTSGMGQAYRNANNPFDEVKLQTLNDADLIIVSRMIASAHYSSATNLVTWNSLETPILTMSPHLARGNRWNWYTGGEAGGATSTTSMAVAAGQEDHPFVQGFATPIQLYDWSPGTSVPVGGPGQGMHGAPLGNIRSGSIVVGTFAGNAYLVDIPAGTQYGTDSGEEPLVFGGRRVLMSQWGEYTDFSLYNTPAYEQLLGQVIAEIVGENSTPGIPGDINDDGTVSRADLVILLQQYGNQGPGWEADVTNDEFVGLLDLAVVQTHFGLTETAAAAVPEPSTLALALTALGLLTAGGLRRHKAKTARLSS